VSADEDTVAVAQDYFESLPKGTVIKVTDPTGHAFELIAEGRTFRDFTLHHGTASIRLQGRRTRYGGMRLFWSSAVLAQWVADGLCTIELKDKK